jgi:hypothetical protein
LSQIRLFKGEEVVAFYTDENQEEVDFDYEIIEFNEDCLTVMNTWDIFSNDAAIGKISIFDGRQKIKPIPKSVNVLDTKIYLSKKELS